MAELVEQWPSLVGPAIARNAWPARIARDGTLHVHTADSVWAFELGHRAAHIAARAGVPRVRFAPGRLPPPEPDRPPPAPLVATPEEEALATAAAAQFEDENLRETVQKAVRSSLVRGRLDRPFW
jgi:hypothetical protein